jgi:hypothetical protein
VDWFRSGENVGKPRIILAGLLVWVAIVLLFTSFTPVPVKYLNRVRDAYGLPCARGICSKSTEMVYTALRPAVAEDDLIISSNP